MKHMTVGAGVLIAWALLSIAPLAQAQDVSGQSSGGLFGNIDFSIGQMIREETAFRTTDGNPYNENTNYLQNVTVHRQAYVPPSLTVNLVQWGQLPLPYADNLRRGDYVPTSGNHLNYEILRSETEFAVKFGEEFNITGRLRAVYQPDVYNDFNASSVADQQGGITGGIPSIYHGKPNYMGYEVEGSRSPNPLEWSGRNYQVYFPALFGEWHHGNFDMRLGNQQIAWGQEIYLRTFDVPNGLDFRRHLITDRALEEFSDKRIPQISLRATDQLTDTLLVDGFVSKFQPTVYPNANTPYNVIASQFTVHDLYAKEGYDKWNKLDYGIRIKAEYGQWGWQAAFVRRYNPDGAFRWTESGVVKPFNQAPLSLGSVVNTLYGLKLPGCNLGAALCRQYANFGEAMSHTPFEVAPGGVYSFDEWKKYGAIDRIPAIQVWNAAVKDFPALTDVYQTQVDNLDQLQAELNTDFIGAGGSLRGHIAREYFQENMFMLGGTYTIESDNNFLNEMILNLEGQYTPHRVFTAADLNVNFQQEDEYTITATMDKWHRFFESIPATYLVLEVETKNRSDLTGRVLKGYGVDTDKDSPGKSSNATYVVFGFSQPFPNKIYELEFATLIDTGGGMLAQPTVRWHPSGHITVEGFYNYVNGHLGGGEGNNLFSWYGFTNDANLRLTYKF